MTIYTNSSVYVYEEIYLKYMFEMTDENQLVITKRNDVTGSESIHACFNTWDYFILDEEA